MAELDYYLISHITSLASIGVKYNILAMSKEFKNFYESWQKNNGKKIIKIIIPTQIPRRLCPYNTSNIAYADNFNMLNGEKTYHSQYYEPSYLKFEKSHIICEGCDNLIKYQDCDDWKGISGIIYICKNCNRTYCVCGICLNKGRGSLNVQIASMPMRIKKNELIASKNDYLLKTSTNNSPSCENVQFYMAMNTGNMRKNKFWNCNKYDGFKIYQNDVRKFVKNMSLCVDLKNIADDEILDLSTTNNISIKDIRKFTNELVWMAPKNIINYFDRNIVYSENLRIGWANYPDEVSMYYVNVIWYCPRCENYTIEHKV